MVGTDHNWQLLFGSTRLLNLTDLSLGTWYYTSIWHRSIVFVLCCVTGIAFPTCISINNCICHFSPLKTDPEVVIKDGDLVKM